MGTFLITSSPCELSAHISLTRNKAFHFPSTSSVSVMGGDKALLLRITG